MEGRRRERSVILEKQMLFEKKTRLICVMLFVFGLVWTKTVSFKEVTR